MRITAGEFKGRNIKVPKTQNVRPTTERNREAIFNYISNKLDIKGLKVCDLYAGSGSLGLESISRGAGSVHFVENSHFVYKNLIQNIELLRVSNRAKVYLMSALKFSNSAEHDRYDLIFADPPFFRYDIHSVANNILQNGFLEKNGYFLIERSVQTEKEDTNKLGIKPVKKMGDSLIYEFIFY